MAKIGQNQDKLLSVTTDFLPERFRLLMWKLSEQNARDETIFAPSFMFANRVFNCMHGINEIISLHALQSSKHIYRPQILLTVMQSPTESLNITQWGFFGKLCLAYCIVHLLKTLLFICS